MGGGTSLNSRSESGGGTNISLPSTLKSGGAHAPLAPPRFLRQCVCMYVLCMYVGLDLCRCIYMYIIYASIIYLCIYAYLKAYLYTMYVYLYLINAPCRPQETKTASRPTQDIYRYFIPKECSMFCISSADYSQAELI